MRHIRSTQCQVVITREGLRVRQMDLDKAGKFNVTLVVTSQSVKSLLDRLRRNPLLVNTIYIMGTTVITAGIGYFYWIIATHTYSPHDVGLASALIGAMMLFSMLSNPGIHSTFVQLLPRREPGYQWSLTVNAGMVSGALTGLLASCVLTIALPLFSPAFAIVTRQPVYAFAMIVGVPLATLSILLDYIFVAERVARGMLLRNVAFAGLKIPLLVLPLLLTGIGALGIFSSWILASGISFIVTALILVPRLNRRYYLAVRGVVGEVRSMLPSLGWQHLINLGATAPAYLLPVLVTARLSAIDNAYFYTAWMVSSVFYMIGPAVATSLFAEGSHQLDDLPRKVRSCCVIITVFLVPAMLACLLGERFILSLFGTSYVVHGTLLLTILVASAPPDAIVSIYVAVLRVQGRLGIAALLNLGMALLTLTVAWALLPRWGIAGAGWACLIAPVGGSLVAITHVTVAARSGQVDVRAMWRETYRRATRVRDGSAEV